MSLQQHTVHRMVQPGKTRTTCVLLTLMHACGTNVHASAHVCPEQHGLIKLA